MRHLPMRRAALASLLATGAFGAALTVTATTATAQEPTMRDAIIAVPIAPPIISGAADAASRDRAAAADAVLAIARSADLHQRDLVRAAFADTTTLDYGAPERLTPGEIVGRWQPLLEAFDATQHQVYALTVDLAGDRATAAARFQATHTPGREVWVLTGRYEYELGRTATARARPTP